MVNRESAMSKNGDKKRMVLAYIESPIIAVSTKAVGIGAYPGASSVEFWLPKRCVEWFHIAGEKMPVISDRVQADQYAEDACMEEWLAEEKGLPWEELGR